MLKKPALLGNQQKIFLRMNKLFCNYDPAFCNPFSLHKLFALNKQEFFKANFGRFFPAKSKRCLDIGPGEGDLLRLLKQLGYKKIEAIDISTAVCQNLSRQGLPCKLVSDSEKFLEKHKNCYDLIAALDVLEHLPYVKLENFLKAIFEALKPGGCFLISTPNSQSPDALALISVDITHQIMVFSEASLTQLLKSIGFTKIKVFGLKIPPSASQNPLIKTLLFICQNLAAPFYFSLVKLRRLTTSGLYSRILERGLGVVAYKE